MNTKVKPTMCLHSMTIQGNSHSAVKYVNENGLADLVVQFVTSGTGNYVIAILRMTLEQKIALQAAGKV